VVLAVKQRLFGNVPERIGLGTEIVLVNRLDDFFNDLAGGGSRGFFDCTSCRIRRFL
jgi:hypothetical protein